MSSVLRNPDAASGLGKLPRSMPFVVREVLFQANLQHTGCLRCGIGPHHVLQCPHLGREEAGEMDQQAFRRWTVLIGEELLLYGSSSSVEAYKDGAQARMVSRKELPKRPPRLMRRDTPTIPQVSSPILPTPLNINNRWQFHLWPSRRQRKERARQNLSRKFSQSQQQ